MFRGRRAGLAAMLAWGTALAMAGCATSPREALVERTLAAIALDDPVFGGGSILEQRLFSPFHTTPGGDPSERAEFVRRLRDRADAEAVALARELVTPDLASDIADFLLSPTANAWWAAEGLALSAYLMPADDFPARMLAAYGDPALLGLAGLGRIRELAADPSLSPSPPQLAELLGCTRLSPDQALAILSLASGAGGSRWIDARKVAFTRSEQRFLAARQEAQARGFVVDALAELADSKLPRFLPAEPEQAAITFMLVDADGWYVDGQRVAAVGDAVALRKAALELRQRGLASGRLSLSTEPEEDRPAGCVREPVQIVVPEGTQWPAIEALMRELSAPDVAMWRVMVEGAPAELPPSIRTGPGS